MQDLGGSVLKLNASNVTVRCTMKVKVKVPLFPHYINLLYKRKQRILPSVRRLAGA